MSSSSDRDGAGGDVDRGAIARHRDAGSPASFHPRRGWSSSPVADDGARTVRGQLDRMTTTLNARVAA